MRLRRALAAAALLGAALATLAACARIVRQRRAVAPPAAAPTLDRRSPFLKAHLRDGRVYILSRWSATDRAVAGTGRLLGVNRDTLAEGDFTLPIDSVALFETNVVENHPAVAAMAVVTGASLVGTAACLSNPKACFGSCPTFFVTDGSRELLQAEGFSASVSPALEARDVDALWRARPAGRDVELRMTNEALETHVVRHARLLAAPRPPGGRVVALEDGTLREATALAPPTRCAAAEGDCLPSVAAFDGVERGSRADSTDLAARETIELAFDASAGAGDTLGLVIASRQSLLSTFVFYQALAWMGRSAGELLASLERGDAGAAARVKGIGALLGGIEVSVRDAAGEWRVAGETNETGPLATDVRVVPIARPGPGPVAVRLRLTRGHWRVDQVQLAVLGRAVTPVALDPVAVRRGAVPDDDARRRLVEGRAPLVTLPGDEYTLVYRLPADPGGLELLLDTRGYYLEWMRDEWLAEESAPRAALLLAAPAAALRALAPEFARREGAMEALFWGSRYARP